MCAPICKLSGSPHWRGCTRYLRWSSFIVCGALLAAATRAPAQADTSRRGATSAPISRLVRGDDGGMRDVERELRAQLERAPRSDLPLDYLDNMNPDGALPEMSRNRQGELDALMSGAFHDAVRARDVTLITYRQLIQKEGLQSMRRPGEE